MNEADILKAIANETRLQMVKWLKDPETHFPTANPETSDLGICCGLLQKKSGLSQSTVSNYLSILERCGLLIATRHKQWTYYKRNEAIIRRFIARLEHALYPDIS